MYLTGCIFHKPFKYDITLQLAHTYICIYSTSDALTIVLCSQPIPQATYQLDTRYTHGECHKAMYIKV